MRTLQTRRILFLIQRASFLMCAECDVCMAASTHRSPVRVTLLCAWVLLAAAMSGCASPVLSPAIRPQPSTPQALLWGHPYPNLTIVVAYVEGFEPSEAALQEMMTILEEVTDKETIVLEGPTILSNHSNDPHRAWSNEDLNEMHRQHNRNYEHGQGSTAYLFVTYLDGLLDDDPSDDDWARGAAIENDVFLFYEGIRANYAGGAVPRFGAENMERHVLMHELGHALGLVNCGIPMLTEREAGNSDCHSTEKESVMTPGIEDWKSDADAMIGRDSTLAPLHFTAADMRDLIAYRDAGRNAFAR